MRKTWIVLSLLILIFFSSSVFAKSGCCSGHNGVNCSAGAQGNGNVICNDGWTGSSCLYSEMVMCGGSSGGTTNSQPTYIPPTEIIYPTNTPIPLPTWTPIPTNTPVPTDTPTPTVTLTSIPTKNVLSAETENPTPTSIPQTQTSGEPTLAGFISLLILGVGGYWFLKRKKPTT